MKWPRRWFSNTVSLRKSLYLKLAAFFMGSRSAAYSRFSVTYFSIATWSYWFVWPEKISEPSMPVPGGRPPILHFFVLLYKPFILCLILFKDSFFLSNLLTPARLRESHTKVDLIYISSGESHANEGLKFTSSNHGFKSESISISNPKISKQLVLCVPFFFMEF